ncbi:hypothetical protein EON62_06470, partial [archaeon]
MEGWLWKRAVRARDKGLFATLGKNSWTNRYFIADAATGEVAYSHGPTFPPIYTIHVTSACTMSTDASRPFAFALKFSPVVGGEPTEQLVAAAANENTFRTWTLFLQTMIESGEASGLSPTQYRAFQTSLGVAAEHGVTNPLAASGAPVVGSAAHAVTTAGPGAPLATESSTQPARSSVTGPRRTRNSVAASVASTATSSGAGAASSTVGVTSTSSALLGTKVHDPAAATRAVMEDVPLPRGSWDASGASHPTLEMDGDVAPELVESSDVKAAVAAVAAAG